MSNAIQRIDSNERLSCIVIHNGVVHVAGVTAGDITGAVVVVLEAGGRTKHPARAHIPGQVAVGGQVVARQVGLILRQDQHRTLRTHRAGLAGQRRF